MDRKLFNLKNIAIVAVFSLMAFVGFSAFTNNKVEDAKKVLVDKEAWYPINVTADTDYSDQEITGTPVAEFDVTDPCQENFSGDFCAIRLNFEVEEEDPQPILPNGTTVQEAIDLYGATVILDGSLNPVYARHELEN